jgi:CLIP-associating protein 1/2
LTLSVAPLLKSSSQLLLTAVLSNFLPIYLPLLPASSQYLRLALIQFLPSLLDKLNDPKERIHSLASSSISTLGKQVYDDELGANGVGPTAVGAKGKEKETMVGFWERHVKETLGGKGARGKVEGMKMLTRMREEDEQGRFGLKPWIAPLVDLLEDGDGSVRDQAKEVSAIMVIINSAY